MKSLDLNYCLGLGKVDKNCHLVGSQPKQIFSEVFGRDPSQSELDNLIQNQTSGFGGSSKAVIDLSPEEYRSYLQQSPAGQTQARNTFNDKLRGEEEGFLGRFRTEFPTILSGIENQLNLPNLRQTAFNTSNILEDIPNVQELAARGKDIGANQLQRITQAGIQEFAPIAQKATSQAQFAEEEFGRQADRALVPFQTEIDLMKDRFAREATGFNQDAQNQLDLLINKMQTEAQLSIADMNNATRLAELEATNEQLKNSWESIDLGNRVMLVDSSGKQIGSFDKGKLSSSSSSTDWTKYLNNSSGSSAYISNGTGASSGGGLDTLYGQTVGG